MCCGKGRRKTGPRRKTQSGLKKATPVKCQHPKSRYVDSNQRECLECGVTYDSPACGNVGQTREGSITVICTQPVGHKGKHGGMGCEWS